MPSPSTSRTRRSRAPSPESQRSPASDLFGKVAKGLLEYSIHHYLTRQSSSTAKQPSSSPKSKEMASKHSSSDDKSARAFGFSSSNSRRDDPTHELISHLLRGAAALAARHFIKNRGKKKDKSKPRSKAPRGRDDFVGAPVPEKRPHRHRHRRRAHRHDRPTGPQPEIVVALDSLSAELARTTTNIRRMAGARRPHRHRDGRCDVYEGLVSCASRLEASTERVRTGVNNIRNLGEGQLGGYLRRGEGDREWYGRAAPELQVNGGNSEKREGSWVRTRPVPERAGSYVRTRAAPEESKPQDVSKRKVRVSREEDRGRKRTRSR